ncbi:MAG: MarR family transcriptional regulator [Rhodobacteraceae bacterium]|nr:MarR family transcriptional regulator [Paracoccaceae bacterium]
MNDNSKSQNLASNKLLYLTDKEINDGIEAIMFAYRAFTSEADSILASSGYGRAHHRALHFINNRPTLNISQLQEILAISKQSLNRVLRQLINDSLVESRSDPKDRRSRHLILTPTGQQLARKLADVQHNHIRTAYLKAGPEAVAGFRSVLDHLTNPGDQELAKLNDQ